MKDAFTAIHEWFVRFDEHAIHLVVHSPNQAAWEQQIAWEQITRICFRAGRWSTSGDMFLSTSEKPDGYLIPVDADGGKALWSEIRVRGLFSNAMAYEAVGAPDELFCSPRRTGNDVIQTFPLYSPRQLPDLDGAEIALTWDQDGADSIVRYGDMTVWRERTGWEVYDRFEEIALILKHKYGSRLVDLVPTPNSRYALIGDSSAATFHVASAREALGKDAPVERFYWNQLQDAVRTGDNETIRRFLAQGGDPNMRRAPHDKNDTLLHMAARRRQVAIARMLIAAGAYVNVLDALLASPLVAAMDNRFLIAARPPPGRLRIDPETLEIERTTELVTMLALAGANLSGLDRPYSQITGRQREFYQPPLHLAARYGYLDVLRLLLDNGAEADIDDFFANTPLHEALNYGQAQVATMLIGAGADVNRARNQPGNPAETPLLMLVKSHEYDTDEKLSLIQALAEAGADANKTNTVGDSPVLAAVRYGTDQRYSIIGVTDKGGAFSWRIEAWPVYEKLPPAQIAALVAALRAVGADIDARDRDGKTARDLALEAGLADVAALV
jgi:ankyrin repeat protein